MKALAQVWCFWGGSKFGEDEGVVTEGGRSDL